MLKPGLYEQVINKQITDELAKCEDEKEIGKIDSAESSVILSKYVADVVENSLRRIGEKESNLPNQVNLINRIVSVIESETNDDELDGMAVEQSAEQLLAIINNSNTLQPKKTITRPETSIARSSLFTGAVHEPQMFTELKKEIISSNRIDMLVSFIKWSGLRLIIDELTEFTQNGGELRIITTSYMGATDVKAIEELRKLQNTKIKVSYDTKRTRLHAKTYVFYRDTGFTTAYVGSSNITNAAMTSGLEWNVKITQKDLKETLEKINATFESYWNSSEFEYYDEGQKERLAKALKAEKYSDTNNEQIYTVDINPYSYQQEILDKLEAERSIRGYYRNLVVAATGTGKTVISAFDYKIFKKQNIDKPCRLLFVAHREEILKQSLYTFRAVLKDANFGEMFVGNYKPEKIDHLFISIQTFNSQDFTSRTQSDYYDYIIVDEFHHAAAPTYQKLLNYYHPKILLGLTATPERMDGKSILSYFDNRIAAEIRLPEAIDRKLLCPFQYFGVSDTIDLDKLKWARGGYDRKELSNIYTLSGSLANSRADYVVRSVFKYVTDINDVKGLGFCVSVEHAEFMSNYFNSHGISSMFLTGNSPDEDRKNAKIRLVNGEIRFIFVVDIYNEGVDIPEVNTVLFLRPTESLTIFLQQLGRGLRLAENKDCLTVLDFIGQANKRYNFEDKFNALLSNTKRGVSREIKDGFISLPKGCYIKLEKVAAEHILTNIRASIGSKKGLIERIKSFENDTGKDLTYKNFIDYYHINPMNLYNHKYTFYSLCREAGIIDYEDSDLDSDSANILHRLSSIDSVSWIKTINGKIDSISSNDWNSLSKYEQLIWKMLYVSIWVKPAEQFGFDNFLEGICRFRENKRLFSEFKDLLEYCYNKIDLNGISPKLAYDCPLEVNCTYTREQALAGLDFLENYSVSEGVKYLKDKDTDVLFITLNKSNSYYSPTTAYEDYSINETLFHWQSQSTTSDTSKTGERYISKNGSNGHILLFVRENKSDDDGAQPFVFLGDASYVSHSGSRPMNIIWKLKNPIPAKFLKKTNKLIVG